ncbi:MAG: NAD(P)-binding domain-containing protein [Patescibacteria group bacterium]
MLKTHQMGFIGGGRVTHLLLTGLKRRSALPEKVLVSDPDASHLQKLTAIAPQCIQSVKSNWETAQAELIFLAVHPPVIAEIAAEIREALPPDAVLISLLPTVTVQKLSNLLGGFSRIGRMIPNAPSIIGMGYNPVFFSEALSSDERAALQALFANWGTAPEVPEKDLEAYAMVTGMGPTYFWFQWLELLRLAQEFGLDAASARQAISVMLNGAVETLFSSDLADEQVLDLITSYPLKKDEDTIRGIFEGKLGNLYRKLKAGTS